MQVAVFLLLQGDQSVAADIARGRAIATRWCSECHVTAPGQRLGSDNVPTFSEINKSKHFDEARLSAFLSAPRHSRMPDLSLTRAEIADLVAYIKSQRP
ncbi:cytochrome c family protein [Sinorhizobium sp. GL28]|uniref:c-type cytochrome n=1 Tax=Sinorhizobium sp. GL28 TaxID=1358418 RepID=UPI000725CD06|nr:c-type cytochrome [Sinorhizobium sp. GL28]KSV88548.1 hypothetical protein N184_28770 [Sinorhizobium sp. GL28]